MPLAPVHLLRRRHCLLGLAGLPWVAGAAPPAEDSNPDESPIWRKLRAQYFDDRSPPLASPEALSLSAPKRASDPAFVPLATRRTAASTGGAAIRRLSLIIDQNPSPLAAIFELPEGGALADLETRVRVDEYTHVRAIAELSDGSLVMAVRFVKASGGCSAPPGKDPQAALASLGKMRLRVDGDVRLGQPVLAQLMISHPNHSGLAMDQSTRQYTPAHFVRRIAISYAGSPVLTADLDFAISENPNFRFHFVPQRAGELKAEVIDTQDLRFESALALVPAR